MGKQTILMLLLLGSVSYLEAYARGGYGGGYDRYAHPDYNQMQRSPTMSGAYPYAHPYDSANYGSGWNSSGTTVVSSQPYYPPYPPPPQQSQSTPYPNYQQYTPPPTPPSQ